MIRDARDDRLFDQIEAYLDGQMNPEQVEEIEHVLRTDKDARDMLVDLLTLRGLIELALGERGPEHGLRCKTVQGLLTPFAEQRLNPRLAEAISEHLEACQPCFSKCMVPTSRESRSWWRRMPVATVAVVLLAAGAAGYFVLRGSGGSDAGPPWPALPGPILDCVQSLVDREPGSDQDRVTEAMARCGEREPDALRTVLDAPRVRKELRRLDLSKLSAPQTRQVAFLVAFLHEPRLSDGQRRQALAPLARLLGVAARPLLHDVLKSAGDETLVRDAVLRLDAIGLKAGDRPVLRQAFEDAIAWKHQIGVAELLDALEVLDDPDTPSRCFQILEGTHGSFPRTEFPDAASVVVRFADRRGPQDLIARLEATARDGSFALGKAAALRALWKKTRDDQWHKMLVEMAAHPEEPVRAVVADHLAQVATEDDRQAVERLAGDKSPRVAAPAGDALRALNAKREGR